MAMILEWDPYFFKFWFSGLTEPSDQINRGEACGRQIWESCNKILSITAQIKLPAAVPKTQNEDSSVTPSSTCSPL